MNRYMCLCVCIFTYTYMYVCTHHLHNSVLYRFAHRQHEHPAEMICASSQEICVYAECVNYITDGVL